MRIQTFISFVVGVVVVGVLVNFASDSLNAAFPGAGKIAVQVAILVMALWAFAIGARAGIARVTAGRYAVETLILNSRNELLVYRHPHHKRMLPPGGRIRRLEFPEDAVQNRLKERLGLSQDQYKFDERFHHGLNANSGNLGDVQRVAAPFLAQRELHRQRRYVSTHYDLMYVLMLADDNIDFSGAKYGPVHFVDLAALEEMAAQGRTYPDVIDAYKRVLSVIAGGNA